MDNSEAPIVMWTNYKRTDGFEVSLTIRGTDLKEVATGLDTAIKQIVAGGGTPVSRQKTGFPPKPVDYVEGRECPKCKSKLVRATTKAGKKMIKCSTNKWINGAAQGCDFIEWINDQPAIPERQFNEDYQKIRAQEEYEESGDR